MCERKIEIYNYKFESQKCFFDVVRRSYHQTYIIDLKTVSSMGVLSKIVDMTGCLLLSVLFSRDE